MSNRKPLVILSGEIKTPPFSEDARIEAGVLLGILQMGGMPAMPKVRPMLGIGQRCLEIRVKDKTAEWRLFCRVDADAVLLAHVFAKKTQKTPQSVLDVCRKRLKDYDVKTR